MSGGDDTYKFNAPSEYFDLANEDVEVDESYFDCPRSADFLKEDKPTLREREEQTQKETEHQKEIEEQKQKEMKEEKMELKEENPEKEQEHADDIEMMEEGDDETENVQLKEEQKTHVQPSSHDLPMETPKRHPPTPHDGQQHPHDQDEPKAVIVKPVKGGRKSDVARVGVRQSPRLAAISKALRRSNADRRSSGSRRSSGGSRRSTQGSQVAKVRTSHKGSIPKVSGVQGLNTEDEAQLETIATFKKKIADYKKNKATKTVRTGPTKPQEFHFATDTRLRQKDVVTKEQVKDSDNQHKSSKPLGPTIPQEFHFATDKCIKTTTKPEEEEAVDFAKSLRSSTNSLNKDVCKTRTIPQPFNLTEPRKGKLEESNKFVSMAELNLKFHTKTPQRFRSKRAGSVDEPEPEEKKKCGGITIPNTPNLSTRSRTRNLNYLTHEEQEQKEFEEAQKQAFKAHPVNKKALEQPSTGYQVEKKVKAPEIFHAPQPKKALALPGMNFQEMCEKLAGSAASLASLPHGGLKWEHKTTAKWDKTSTKPQPFSFDSKDKSRFQQKEEKIKKFVEEEKKLAEFHANPMPLFEDGVRGVPPKKPPTPTRARPFNLKSDERGEIKKEQFKKKLMDEEKMDEERRKFLAQSDEVVHRQPFLPAKSNKPLTDISGFTLNTEIRADERNDYDLHRKQKEDEIMAAKREQEERKAAEEAAEVARLRREAVHKAHPVRKFKPMVIHPASQPLTDPKSPNFATDSRMRTRTTRSNSTLNISSATFTAE